MALNRRLPQWTTDDVLNRMIAMGVTSLVSPRALAIVAGGMNDRALALSQLDRAFELRRSIPLTSRQARAVYLSRTRSGPAKDA